MAALAAISCGQSNPPSSGAAGASAGGSANNHAGGGGGGGKDATPDTTDAGAAGAAEADAGSAGSSSAGTANASGGAGGGGTSGGPSGGEAGEAPVPANDLCADAKVIPLGATPSVDIQATTLGANHEIDAPCESGGGADVFYQFDISKRVFVYADTFGASWDTVLYLLSNDCVPLAAPTTAGDDVCNGSACGTSQSRIVALLEAGRYRLGLSGRGAAAGAATIHFQWALAGSGSAAQLPKGNTVQMGTTAGSSGSIQGLSALCLAAGPENSYWWSSCPSDLGGSLSASTCGGASWETVLDLELPASAPYTCSLDSCSLQASLSSTIPAGAGLRVLSVDGQGGTDRGAYTMTVSRP